MYVWICRHEVDGGSWEDWERCSACSKKGAKTRAVAQAGADAHERRSGHGKIEVKQIDGRSLRGWRWRG